MFSKRAEKLPPFYVMEVLERAQQLEREGKNIIHLEIGEPDFETPSHICDAALSALKSGETRYTHSLGILKLREAIAESYNKKFGLNISHEQVIVTSGTSPALLLVFMGILDKGDEVIMSNPYYACYPNFVKYQGGKPIYVHGFNFNINEVSKKKTKNTKAILINSPCNPTGYVIEDKILKNLVDLAGNIPIISDEIYQGLIYEGKDHSILEYTDNAFVLNGFSKLYAMTGWRLGYLIAPLNYVKIFQKIQQNFFICANNFVQCAGISALTGSQEFIKEMLTTYDKRRKYMLKRLKEIGFEIKIEPTGAYYILADARKFGGDSLKLSRFILEETGVAVTPGIDFGEEAEGHLRFSYANSLNNIKEGLDRIEKFLLT